MEGPRVLGGVSREVPRGSVEPVVQLEAGAEGYPGPTEERPSSSRQGTWFDATSFDDMDLGAATAAGLGEGVVQRGGVGGSVTSPMLTHHAEGFDSLMQLEWVQSSASTTSFSCWWIRLRSLIVPVAGAGNRGGLEPLRSLSLLWHSASSEHQVGGAPRLLLVGSANLLAVVWSF